VNELIVRIAARGEGVTASGHHVPFGVPGDALLDDGALAPGKHHQVPPCRHFPECGGCQLQHADDEAYRDYLASRVETALAQHHVTTEILEPYLSPPKSRRRAVLRAVRISDRTMLGFNAGKSHRIIDVRECHILRPELFALLTSLRKLLASLVKPRQSVEVNLTLVDQGPDVLLRGVAAEGLASLEQLTSFAAQHDLARLSIDHGLGPETLFEPIPATVTLSGVPVGFPAAGFLQATEDGQQALVQAVNQGLHGSKNAADLFCGIGTFALANHVSYAAEASRDAVAALKRAAPGLIVEHRDLYRRPLDSAELERFDGIILDPPRAGAAEQIAAVARSSVPRVAYVSCNPATFARDAKTLIDGGYELEWVRPVGQFRWSTHVELVGVFIRHHK
jgi:23S rRNA (uracil1939-C5)-methyltransferase